MANVIRFQSQRNMYVNTLRFNVSLGDFLLLLLVRSYNFTGCFRQIHDTASSPARLKGD